MFLRIERALFYFFLFSLPFQTRIILKEWFIRLRIGGGGGTEFNEWSSAFLYFTDLLIIAILFLWVLRLISKIASRNWFIITEKKNYSLFIIVCLFFSASLLSLFKAQNLGIGIYQLIKLAELILLFLYLKANFKKLFELRHICQILIASGLSQTFIAICQFASQKSLGLKILGESSLGPNIEGVAKIVVSGTKIVRAYGTFPHPNVLAAFLLFSVFAFYFLYLKIKKPCFGVKLASLTILTFLTFGLFLTFSRTLISLFIIFSIIIFLCLFFKKGFYRPYHQRVLSLATLFLVVVILCGASMIPELYSRFIVSSVDPGINLRFFYNFISSSMLKESPFLGIGLGNFVWGLQDFQGSLRAANLIYKLDIPETKVVSYQAPSWLYQPTHNVYLLIASEIGIFGLLIFLIFLGFLVYPLIKVFKENNLFFIFYFLFFIFLIIFLTDHFFWTLQQGRLMFWLLCGILASRVDI